jgi:phosphomannomutase
MPVTEPIISVSGLRGIVGRSLTPEIVSRYVSAFAAAQEPGPIVVGRDGRESGPMLLEFVCGALAQCGREVQSAGIAATPTIGVLVSELGAAGGVQISASHNPPEYNGLKLFSPAGRVLPKTAGEAVLAAYRQSPSEVKTVRQSVDPLPDPNSQHLARVLSLVEIAAIQKCRFNVLLDSNAGAGSCLGRRLLEELGCRVTLLGGQPDGRFLHPPEPTADNLQGVRKDAQAARADVAFCQDPDADRLAIIDETGAYIGEEYTLALCLDHVLRTRVGPVVVNCATSRMSQDLAARYQAPFFRAAVGEANVVDKMLEVEAVFGGEGNGGPIDPRVGLVRDSFLGMALVLAAMAGRQKKISELVAELPRYEIRKQTVALDGAKLPAALDALQKHFGEAQADRLDGLRLDWPDRWLIVRGSNTEPIVRIIAEGPSAVAAESLVAATARVLEQL